MLKCGSLNLDKVDFEMDAGPDQEPLRCWAFLVYLRDGFVNACKTILNSTALRYVFENTEKGVTIAGSTTYYRTQVTQTAEYGIDHSR